MRVRMEPLRLLALLRGFAVALCDRIEPAELVIVQADRQLRALSRGRWRFPCSLRTSKSLGVGPQVLDDDGDVALGAAKAIGTGL